MALVVQKYGGTSVGDIERIQNVARRVWQTQQESHDVVVVVSAMSGETDRLLDLANSMGGGENRRERDVLVSTGEQATSALLAMAIRSRGGRAKSFTGYQVRITTDNNHSNARINHIDDSRIRSALQEGNIVVVAGFQGVDGGGNITTLGRGGSDTTAVALAAALKADCCEIYTDVDGVYTADPRICPHARKLDRVTCDEMLEMASLGAKVLQIRSVAFAKKYNVPIHVRSSFHQSPGTWVSNEVREMESITITGVTSNKNEARISLCHVPDIPGVAARVFTPLSKANIAVDMIIQNSSMLEAPSGGSFTDLTFTVSKEDFPRAERIARQVADEVEAGDVVTDLDIAKVSIVGVGIRSHAWIAATMFDHLASNGINIEMISTSEIKISCVVASDQAEMAVRILHDYYFGERQKQGKAEEDAVVEGQGSC